MSQWWERVKKKRDSTNPFAPTGLDRECDKAARILRSFCIDGFHVEGDTTPKYITGDTVRNAGGLAIFSITRTVVAAGGVTGSGIVVGRLDDGSWSAPLAVQVHAAGLGFLPGVEVYDCVVAVDDAAALAKAKCTLGAETPGSIRLKSRKFEAKVQIEGTVIEVREDENERFYKEKIPVEELLARRPPHTLRPFMETLRAAQGDEDAHRDVIPSEPSPGDSVVDDGHLFGIPDRQDPDPYGVLALEKEGFSLKEAGTNKRASWEQFSFQPSPTSPAHALYYPQRRSMGPNNRMSWFNMLGRLSLDQESKKTSAGTQTEPPSAISRKSSISSILRPRRGSMVSVQTNLARHSRGASQTSVFTQREPASAISPHAEVDEEVSPVSPLQEDEGERDIALEPIQPAPIPPSDSDLESEPEVEIVEAVQQPTVSRPRLVSVPKRVPPKLPPRNPSRTQIPPEELRRDSGALSPTKEQAAS
ncbi:hypothetical protein K470DRAFT_263144 [Piedraia hortae CBS 480.64]|uniref:Ysc84 actin-binding domain-containing protein n=1 Tax=Piedraia hortae CBS 480.64 TaxID=1314780 RepID=A0A6A7C3E5_9PEZI|nr:hypothetical protein K470DRAFT_263144 [Piedraia hortae CBS 480.64]